MEPFKTLPDIDALRRKLMENRRLTGAEREFMFHYLSGNVDLSQSGQRVIPGQKRRVGASTSPARPCKSKKIQVDTSVLLKQIKDTQTQTDDTVDYLDENSASTSRDADRRARSLAAQERVDPAAVQEVMSEGFMDRRNFILLQCPIVRVVKEKYPLLFSASEVRNELDRIFYDGKCDEFLVRISDYAECILSLVRTDDPLLLTALKKADEAVTVEQRKYAMEVGSLLLLSSIVFESRNYLRLANTIHEDEPLPSIPIIEVNCSLEGILKKRRRFKIYVEGVLLCSSQDFREAIMCLMGCYYIFHIQYDGKNCHFLIALERLFLCRCDTELTDKFVKRMVKMVRLKQQSGFVLNY